MSNFSPHEKGLRVGIITLKTLNQLNYCFKFKSHTVSEVFTNVLYTQLIIVIKCNNVYFSSMFQET